MLRSLVELPGLQNWRRREGEQLASGFPGSRPGHAPPPPGRGVSLELFPSPSSRLAGHANTFTVPAAPYHGAWRGRPHFVTGCARRVYCRRRHRRLSGTHRLRRFRHAARLSTSAARCHPLSCEGRCTLPMPVLYFPATYDIRHDVVTGGCHRRSPSRLRPGLPEVPFHMTTR